MRTSDLTDTHNRKGKAQQTSHFRFFEAHLVTQIRIRPQSSWCNSRLFLLPYLLIPYSPCGSQGKLGWGDSASTCHTRGVFSFSLSSGCDSGSAFIPLPSIQRLRQTGVYGNTVAESSPSLCFMNQWNMLQILYPATPFPGSTLTFAHNSLLSSCNMQRRGLRLFSSWECTEWWENPGKECYYHCVTFYI